MIKGGGGKGEDSRRTLKGQEKRIDLRRISVGQQGEKEKRRGGAPGFNPEERGKPRSIFYHLREEGKKIRGEKRGFAYFRLCSWWE